MPIFVNLMRLVFILFSVFSIVMVKAQIFSGQVFMRESTTLYLNQLFVTNITTQKTVLSNYNGEFKIQAKVGDVIRFTSIITERTDVKITEKLLENTMNFIELKPAYHEIQEVIIGWRPTGNLRRDVTTLKDSKRKMEIASIIGLPAPKGDGTSPTEPIAGFRDGNFSLSIDGIYDLISGERKKKQRLYEYEKMMSVTQKIKNYFGEDYFVKLKIPKNMIDNFLQFVYSSDNILVFVEGKNMEATQAYIEKYLPIYIKRLRQSNMMGLGEDFNKNP